MKVLLVEDNERVAQFVRKGLLEEGHIVDHADNGRDGLFFAASGQYDVMILDRMLPGGVDGLGIVEVLRKTGNKTPILILSALAEVDDRIRGLRAGGDDYLTKPFAFGELAARLEALVRRSKGVEIQTVLTVADLRIDLLSHRVTRGGKPIQLQRREFKLLEYLVRHAGQVVTRTMRRKKIAKREAIVTQLVNKSAAADLKATQIVLAMLRDLECQADDPGEATVFTEADQEIIRRIQARLRNEKG